MKMKCSQCGKEIFPSMNWRNVSYPNGDVNSFCSEDCLYEFQYDLVMK
jgi:hypothetical protein